jgi:hypothetical protein
LSRIARCGVTAANARPIILSSRRHGLHNLEWLQGAQFAVDGREARIFDSVSGRAITGFGVFCRAFFRETLGAYAKNSQSNSTAFTGPLGQRG